MAKSVSEYNVRYELSSVGHLLGFPVTDIRHTWNIVKKKNARNRSTNVMKRKKMKERDGHVAGVS